MTSLFTDLYLCLAAFQVFLELLPMAAAPDNRGSEFIIGYMENKQSGSSTISLSPELYVTTMKTTTVYVRVNAPLYTASTIDETFSVTAGEVKILSFGSDIRVTGTTLSSKGIWVKADDEIVIYGVNPEEHSGDAFLGLPTDVLGTEYYVITWGPATRQCELLVVGVNDSTTVNIKLNEAIDNSKVTWNGTDYYKDDTITTTINRYETLQLTSDGDLTGSYITSDYIVSVFSGNKKTRIGTGTTSDHLVEQWPPVSTFGKTFATVPIPGRTIGDKFKFVASEDNTQVNITANNYSIAFTLSLAGSHEEKDIESDSYCYVQADKPILVAQFCKSQTSSTVDTYDPMMTMIPPIELYAADYTFATPQYSRAPYINYFMFVVKDSDKTGLLVDGSAFNASTVYNSIPGTDLVGGYIEVSEGTHQIRHTSPISVFGGYFFGTESKETYGFPTGSRFASINSVCVASTNVFGDGIDNDCDGHIDEELCANGNDDDADGFTDEDCAMPSPINGNWTDWTVWSSCSITCTNNGSLVSGTITRTRTCTNPIPQYDGDQCRGDNNETSSCSISADCQESTTKDATMTMESTTTGTNTLTVETTAFISAADTTAAENPETTLTSTTEQTSSVNTHNTDETTSEAKATITTTTDTTTVTEELTVTSTADTPIADDTKTTLNSTSEATSIDTIQPYTSAGIIQTSTETTTEDDTNSSDKTIITTTTVAEDLTDTSTAYTPIADDTKTTLTSTFETTSIDIIQPYTSAGTIQTSTKSSTKDATTTMESTTTSTNTLTVETTAFISAADTTTAENPETTLTSINEKTSSVDAQITDETTSEETTTITTTTDTTTVTEDLTVTSTADTPIADDTKTTLNSTSEATSIDTIQPYTSAGTIQTSTDATTTMESTASGTTSLTVETTALTSATDTTASDNPEITLTYTSEITSSEFKITTEETTSSEKNIFTTTTDTTTDTTTVTEELTYTSTADSPIADDTKTTLTSNSDTTSIDTTQPYTSAGTIQTSTGTFNNMVFSGVVIASILGACCAFCLIWALRRRLLKFKRMVKPKEAFKDDFGEKGHISKNNFDGNKSHKIYSRDPLDF